MKSFIKELFFDKEIVNTIKSSKIDTDRLYTLLFMGRITMKEYLEVAGK